MKYTSFYFFFLFEITLPVEHSLNPKKVSWQSPWSNPQRNHTFVEEFQEDFSKDFSMDSSKSLFRNFSTNAYWDPSRSSFCDFYTGNFQKVSPQIPLGNSPRIFTGYPPRILLDFFFDKFYLDYLTMLLLGFLPLFLIRFIQQSPL